MNSPLDLVSAIEQVEIVLEPGPSGQGILGAARIGPTNWLRRVPRAQSGTTSVTRIRLPESADCAYVWTVPEGGGLSDAGDLTEIAALIESKRIRSQLAATGSPEEFREILLRALPFRDRLREGADPHAVVGRTGVLFGGVIANVRRKLPFYWGDFSDGLNLKAFASVVFMFFACLAPAIAFGGLAAALTNGQLGAVEMLVSTAFCGVVYSLLSAQPLTILGSTGPVIIFIGLLFDLCRRIDIPFLPALAWVGLWTSLILVVLAATEASRLIRWFTRFTDEIFAALISLIFISEALGDSLRGVREADTPRDAAFLAVILALGTYTIAVQLAQFRRGPYLKAVVRNLVSDFGPVIAIVAMVGVAAMMRPVAVETLAVPMKFGTTSGRPWLVDLGAVPLWAQLAAAVPALLVSVLLFLDQNITVRLVNNRKHFLRKGFGYHLDLLVVGLLVGVCSVFGLPWMVAATVRSLNHVQSLAKVEKREEEETIVAVTENRLTALAVHVLIGLSLLFLNELRQVPMPVLFGLFLYMGVSSLRGNQLFERMRLWLMDPQLYPASYYLKAVPNRVVHAFTSIQVSLLAVLWFLKTSSLGILFPLLIALLVPVRFLLDRFFDAHHLSHLDGEEEPEQEQDMALGP